MRLACSVGIPVTIFMTLAIDTRHWRSLGQKVADSVDYVAVVTERK